MRTQESGHRTPLNMARIIKTPVKALSKVLDLYVKSVTNFSNAYNKPLRTMMEVAPPTCRGFPRSFTTSFLPDSDQPSEGPLVRSISAPAAEGKATNVKLTNFELYMIQRHCQRLKSSTSRRATPRSCSVGMGKIDEDRVSSFRYDDIILKSKRCIEDADSMSSKSCIDSMLFLE